VHFLGRASRADVRSPYPGAGMSLKILGLPEFRHSKKLLCSISLRLLGLRDGLLPGVQNVLLALVSFFLDLLLGEKPYLLVFYLLGEKNIKYITFKDSNKGDRDRTNA